MEVAIRVGYDVYWSKSREEREAIIAAVRTLDAIHAMTQYDANPPKRT